MAINSRKPVKLFFAAARRGTAPKNCFANFYKYLDDFVAALLERIGRLISRGRRQIHFRPPVSILRIDILSPYLKSLLIQLDEPTYRALNRVAPAEQRKRAEFVRAAIRKAILETEEARTRQAYRDQPDSESEADGWSNAGKWKS